MKRARGFSLLEILAALALLALLLLAVYSGVRTATHSVHTGSAAIGNIDRLRSAQEFLQRELEQTTALPWALDAKRNPIVFTGDAHEMRYVAPLPGYLGKMGPQLQTLRLVDDGDGTSRLEVSFAMLPTKVGETRNIGEPEVLLTGIRDARFRYIARDDNNLAGDWQDDWRDPTRLPAFVRIELNASKGSAMWPTLDVAIRQGPDAINIRAVAAPLLYGASR